MSPEIPDKKEKILKEFLTNGFSLEEKTLSILKTKGQGYALHGVVLQHGSLTYEIDVLHHVSALPHLKVIFFIECKNFATNWYFPEPQVLPDEGLTFAILRSNNPNFLVEKIKFRPRDLCVWSDFQLKQGNGGAPDRQNSINSIIYKQIKKLEVKIVNDVTPRPPDQSTLYVPVIVTSSPLCSVSCSEDISLKSFEDNTSKTELAERILQVNPRRWLYYNTTQVPLPQLHTAIISNLSEETSVAIVNIESLADFVNQFVKYVQENI